MKPGWRYAKAAVAGARHSAEGRECEDFAAARIIATARGNVLAACVCDGAGASPKAATGARVAAEAFLTGASDRLREGGGVICEADLQDFLAFAALAVTLRAFGEKQLVRDYATTLVAALVADTWSAFVQIGDGAIVVPSDGGRWELVFEPQRGIYANETFSLTDEEAREKAHLRLYSRSVTELAIFSDGLEKALIREAAGSAVADAFFNDMLPIIRQSGAAGEDPVLGESLAVRLASDAIGSYTDGDVSLILASRLAPPQRVPGDVSVSAMAHYAAQG